MIDRLRASARSSGKGPSTMVALPADRDAEHAEDRTRRVEGARRAARGP